MLIRRKKPEDQIAVHLITAPDDGNIQEQRECLDGITEACTETGWKMVLDRRLDIYQPTQRIVNGFSLGERLQELRMMRSFYITYVDLNKALHN